MKKRTFAGKALGDTEYMLEQWGWWRMDGKGVPGCVSQLDAMISHNTPSATPAKQYVITDDLALAIDGAVARLCVRNQEMGDFIWLYYGEKWPALRIGRQFGIGEAKARELIKTGVAWIDCALEKIRDAA